MPLGSYFLGFGLATTFVMQNFLTVDSMRPSAFFPLAGLLLLCASGVFGFMARGEGRTRKLVFISGGSSIVSGESVVAMLIAHTHAPTIISGTSVPDSGQACHTHPQPQLIWTPLTHVLKCFMCLS